MAITKTEVAATYLSWERLSSPFKENDKWYITVLNPKTSKEKIVRWYGAIPDTINYNKVFGFDNGYIILFKGINDKNHFFFKEWNIARFSNYFGWYIPSTEIYLPQVDNLPDNIEIYMLKWEEVEGKFTDKKELIKFVESKIGKFYKENIGI